MIEFLDTDEKRSRVFAARGVAAPYRESAPIGCQPFSTSRNREMLVAESMFAGRRRDVAPVASTANSKVKGPLRLGYGIHPNTVHKFNRTNNLC